MIHAAFYGHLDVIDALLYFGADTTICSKGYARGTPAQCAKTDDIRRTIDEWGILAPSASRT